MRFERSGRGQEPSRGHKFSILENFLSIRDFTSQTLASFPSDLVGACLPQTLLIIRTLRLEWNGVSCLHMKTCERIAQENHSSASSVRRAEYYAHGVDVADELSPGFRDRFFREELHIPDYLLENLGKAKPEEQAEIFEEIKNYVPKPKKVKPNKVTVKQAEKAASNTIDENYDVPQKFLELYYRLHNAESLMRKSWEVTFDLNPKLLTHPEQVKVLRFALKPHLEFLKTLDEVLAESSGESSKTA